MRFILCVALGFACGCRHSTATQPDLGEDPVKINERPTGSIQTPSICERAALDARISTSGGADTFAFVWADDHYQLVYSDSTAQDIYAVRLDDQGTVLGTPIVIEQTAAPSTLPNLLRTAGGYAVAWQEADPAAPHVRTHLLDAQGNPIGASQIVAHARSSQTRPVLASSPLGMAISWMDQLPDSTSSGDMIGDSATYVGALDASLALRTDVATQRINPNSQSGYPWLAGDDKAVSLLWVDNIGGAFDPYFAPLDATLLPSSPADVRGATVPQASQLGRLLKTDFGYLAAWEDLRSGSEEIYMSLLDPAGMRYAGGLVEEPQTGNANWPHMAWTGSAAAVVYYQFRRGLPQIFLTFVDQAGARIANAADAQVSNTSASAKFPDVIWNGMEFAIIWVDTRDGGPQLYFNRILCKKPAPI
jgi:hypothetical protein